MSICAFCRHNVLLLSTRTQLTRRSGQIVSRSKPCLSPASSFYSTFITRRPLLSTNYGKDGRTSLLEIHNARRKPSATFVRHHGQLGTPKAGEERTVKFIDKDGERYTYKVADGDNLLDIAQANDLEMEGACGGSCACSTCHVIVEDEAYYDKMEEPTDEENDMLDLAFGLTETSRLGCQVKMNKDLDGLTVKLPSMTRNLQASDFETK